LIASDTKRDDGRDEYGLKEKFKIFLRFGDSIGKKAYRENIKKTNQFSEGFSEGNAVAEGKGSPDSYEKE
jgi:hypothetical protein